jgi:hypothetical protein
LLGFQDARLKTDGARRPTKRFIPNDHCLPIAIAKENETKSALVNNMTGASQRARRHRRQRPRLFLSSIACASYFCLIIIHGGATTARAAVWEPLASFWPRETNRRVDNDDPPPPPSRVSAMQKPAPNSESLSEFFTSATNRSSNQPAQTKTKGWFFGPLQKKREPAPQPPPDDAAAAQQRLMDEATAAILQRQEALRQEATKVMEKIESIALEKGTLLQDGLIEHATARQQELTQEVERLSAWTERLLEDRAHRVEAHARATLQALDRAVVEEGRRIKLMGMALAENTISQAEQKALEGLTALEQNAIDQVVKLASHVLESIRTGAKKKKHSSLFHTPAAILQRNFWVGQGESSRLLVLVRTSAIFMAIILAISPSYWDRVGGNASLVAALLPHDGTRHGLAQWLVHKDRAEALRPAVAAVCAIAAGLLSWRMAPPYEWLSQRAGALLVLIVCRLSTVETTFMSVVAVAFLLTEQQQRPPPNASSQHHQHHHAKLHNGAFVFWPTCARTICDDAAMIYGATFCFFLTTNCQTLLADFYWR